ncbi:hypothetical protein ES703_71176 [subsurface metagenome]
MEHQAQFVHMRKNNLPLVEFAAVETEFLFGARPRPDVLAVAAVDVIRDEINAVHTLAGQVIQGADDAFSFAVFPGWVAGAPVLHVRGVAMQKFFTCSFAFAF